MSWYGWWFGEPEPSVTAEVRGVATISVDMETGKVEGPMPLNEELRNRLALRRVRIDGRQGTLLDRVIFRDYWQARGAREVDLIRDFTKRENCHREMLKAD